TSGQCFARTRRQNGSISQKATVSKPPVRSKPRLKPPMPEKRSRTRSFCIHRTPTIAHTNAAMPVRDMSQITSSILDCAVMAGLRLALALRFTALTRRQSAPINRMRFLDCLCLALDRLGLLLDMCADCFVCEHEPPIDLARHVAHLAA